MVYHILLLFERKRDEQEEQRNCNKRSSCQYFNINPDVYIFKTGFNPNGGVRIRFPMSGYGNFLTSWVSEKLLESVLLLIPSNSMELKFESRE